MKTTSFIKTLAIGTAVVAALSAAVMAQAAPGFGPGNGQGTGSGNRMAQGMHAGFGPGQMQGQQVGRSLLTPEERSANQAKMATVKTYEECKAVQAEQHAAMAARAAEKGMTLPAPQSRGCDMRKARGMFAG
ncbi:MAG: hypothetical protein COW02_11660 [Comamonadaceae bacterium CG12_big_fil_rev_8_21_14_0_65_59_15]|nr:MAG: hypothetical protein COW02_11660 [Comamonadaceae bacterium CG12_big_fil_rev_8_21_14_0_65_59_15]